MKTQTIRNLHRDLGYIFLGLIISFAFSGILMNHREYWHPEEYDVQTRKITITPLSENEVTEQYARNFLLPYKITDTYRKHRVRENKLRISFKNTDVEVHLKKGEGEITTYKRTPIISQMMKLHKSTSNWWIYFSDIFGISLIIIAITGATMQKYGKYTFKKYGWKLTAIGLLFPILFLLFS